jgi:hypothetical protein
MVTRAERRDYPHEGYTGEKNMRGFNRLLDMSRQYNKPFEGATRLHGSPDFRVAYRLQELGVGRIASCPIVDGSWFILEQSH